MSCNENGLEICYTCHAAPCRCGDPHYDDGFHFPPTQAELTADAVCGGETEQPHEATTETIDDRIIRHRREIAELEQQIQSAELDLIDAGGYVPGSWRNVSLTRKIGGMKDRISLLHFLLDSAQTRKERTEHERTSTGGDTADGEQ